MGQLPSMGPFTFASPFAIRSHDQLLAVYVNQITAPRGQKSKVKKTGAQQQVSNIQHQA
jgi:hypothetical protein